MSDLILPGSFDSLFGDMGVVRVKTPPAPKSVGCEACGRQKDCKTPKFPIYGNGAKGILIVSEVPGPQDDEDGIPLSGESGTLLRRELKTHGIDLKRDCWVVFAVRCHGPKPSGQQVSACRGFTTRDIASLKPRAIIPTGILAIQAVLDDRIRGRMTGTKPTAFIGCRIPDQEYKAWVCPVEGLAFLAEKTPYGRPRNEDSILLWQRDIRKAVNVPEFPEKPVDDITLCMTAPEATEAVYGAIRAAKEQGEEIGFDLETTGIKPHAPGHRIVCASIAWGDRAWAFPMFEDAEFREAWKCLMVDPDVPKLAHNVQFEAMWTREILGYWPEGWAADTCMDAHVINNTKPTSLKFEVYTRLGIAGYDDAADPYLKADAEGCNAINNIAKCPLPELLKYNALDSLYMGRVRAQQVQDLKEYRPQIKASRFFLDVALELVQCSMSGMRIDLDRMETASRLLKVKIAEKWKEAYDCEEVKRMGPGFKLTSNQDLARLVYDVLGHKGSSRSVDKDVLKDVQADFVAPLLEARKYEKVDGTYFDQYRREQVGGIIRASFSLNRVTSYRGSAGDPNLQNVSKRDKEISDIIRSCFRPSPGNVLIEIDFGQLEAVIGAVFHQDPVMIKYLLDPSVNLHSDSASDLFLRPREFYDTPSTESKAERNAAKQLWFASSYGSNYKLTHQVAWKAVGAATKAHLATKGIKTINDFKEHVAKFDKILWEKRFPVYAEWKKTTYEDCKKNGFIYLKTGFRCHGPLKYTEAINLHVQGSASHLLFWTLLKTNPIIRGMSGRSASIATIHDAVVIDAHPSEVEAIVRLVLDYGTNKVREFWPWITMPLRMEPEVSEVDGSWAKMKPYHLPESESIL